MIGSPVSPSLQEASSSHLTPLRLSHYSLLFIIFFLQEASRYHLRAVRLSLLYILII